jgi:hypothetical protein
MSVQRSRTSSNVTNALKQLVKSVDVSYPDAAIGNFLQPRNLTADAERGHWRGGSMTLFTQCQF